MTPNSPSATRTRKALVGILLVELIAIVLVFVGVQASFAVSVVAMLVAAGALVAICILCLVALVRNRFRFRLSTFWLVTTVTVAGFGVVATHVAKVRYQASAIARLRQLGCDVRYDSPRGNVFETLHIEPWFARVSRVYVVDPPATTDGRIAGIAEQLKLLPYDFELACANTQLTDSGLQPLGTIPHLSALRSGGVTVEGGLVAPLCPQITDAGMAQLAEGRFTGLSLRGKSITCDGLARLKNPQLLRVLNLDHTHVSDANAAVFAGFENLEVLWLQGTHVSDAALEHIASLPRLKQLYFNLTDVTDAGLVRLQELKQLENLGIGGLSLSEEAVDRLRRSLPNCEIFYE